MKKPMLISVLILVGLVALLALAIGGGIYNVAADDEHSAPVHSLLETVRDRSIAARATKLDVPDLAGQERIRRGAGNYDSMCAVCHLKPGAEDTELSRGLYPTPPQLARSAKIDPARAFWVIKHGLKASGMPAWGKSMEDSHIWDMVAFLGQLPQMNAEQYHAEVRASGGHSHGGGETMDQTDEGEHGHSHTDEGEPESGEHEHSHTAEAHSHDEPDADSPASSAKDPVAVVKAFHEALSAGNAATVQALLDPQVLIMEGGNVERSRQEYASHHLPSDLKFMSAVRYRLERETGDTLDDLAWVASEARLTGESAGKAVDAVSTESLVLRKTSGGWRIVHIHWSSRSAKQAG